MNTQAGLLADQLLLDKGISHSDGGHRPTVTVCGHRLYLHHLGEDEDGGGVLGFGPKILILVRTVDSPQVDLLSLNIAEDGYTVTSFTPRRRQVSTATFSTADKHARFSEKLTPFGLVLAAVLEA